MSMRTLTLLIALIVVVLIVQVSHAEERLSLLRDTDFAEGFGAAFIYGSEYTKGRRPPLGEVRKYRDISPWQVFLIPDGPIKKVGIKTHPWDFQEGLHHYFKDKDGHRRKRKFLDSHSWATPERNGPRNEQTTQDNYCRVQSRDEFLGRTGF